MSVIPAESERAGNAAGSDQSSSDATSVSAPEAAAQTAAPALISEQEVIFGTAAGAPVKPAKGVRRWIVALQRVLSTSAADPETPRRYYPRRYRFLEQACMAREMDRL